MKNCLLSCLVFGMLPLVIGVEAKQPNVLFILADDLGIGGLHCYGTDFLETPNIDRLSGDGMKFVNGLAAYPTCKPSRAAILTGQYGPRTGVYRVKNSYGDEDKAKWIIPDNDVVPPREIYFRPGIQRRRLRHGDVWEMACEQ